MDEVPNFRERGSRDFHRIVDAFLLQPDLPFASVLSAERVERVFRKYGQLFGVGKIYSTALVLWSFLNQVLRDGKEASCQAAVARIVAFQSLRGQPAPTSDTGDYCRARSKLSEAALHELSVEVAAEVQSQAASKWLWKGQHAKLIDGFTFTMPDTVKNQAEYPQQTGQKPGVGFPIARSGHHFSGDGLRHGCGNRTLFRQRNRGIRLIAFDARRIVSGGHRGDGSVLLLIHDDRVIAFTRHADLCPKASFTSFGLSAGTAPEQIRPSH